MSSRSLGHPLGRGAVSTLAAVGLGGVGSYFAYRYWLDSHGSKSNKGTSKESGSCDIYYYFGLMEIL
jgi:hypothetical protein